MITAGESNACVLMVIDSEYNEILVVSQVSAYMRLCLYHR